MKQQFDILKDRIPLAERCKMNDHRKCLPKKCDKAGIDLRHNPIYLGVWYHKEDK